MKFVLVHGGWQGGWTWDELSSVLGSRGHEIFAPTLRGLEERNANRTGLTLTDMANGLVHDIEERDLRDVALVGHSGGGPIAQFVADRLPERVRRVVFISAWVLNDGESINDVRPAHSVEAARAQAEQSADYTVPMDPDTWASRFMQDTTPEQLATATARDTRKTHARSTVEQGRALIEELVRRGVASCCCCGGVVAVRCGWRRGRHRGGWRRTGCVAIPGRIIHVSTKAVGLQPPVAAMTMGAVST